MKIIALACLLAAVLSVPRAWAQEDKGCATTDGWEARVRDQALPNDPRDAACRLPDCIEDYCENTSYVCAYRWNHKGSWRRFYDSWGHAPQTSDSTKVRPYKQGDPLINSSPDMKPLCGHAPQRGQAPTSLKPAAAKTPSGSGNPGGPGYGTLYDNLNGASRKNPAAPGAAPAQGTAPIQRTQQQQQTTAPASPPSFDYHPMDGSGTQQWIQHQRELMLRQGQKVKKSTDTVKTPEKDEDSNDDQ